MKNIIYLFIFSMLSAGIMLSGIAMKDSARSGMLMLVLCLVFIGYLRREARKRRRNRFPF